MEKNNKKENSKQSPKVPHKEAETLKKRGITDQFSAEKEAEKLEKIIKTLEETD